MKRFQILANKRFKWLEENQDTLFDLIRKAEGSLYKELLKYVLDLDIDAKGNLKQTSKNVKSLATINKIVDSFNKGKNVGIITRIIDSVKELLGLNKEYFDTVAKGLETSVEQKARQTVMLSLGYDDVKNVVIEGGYLWNLSNGGDLAGSIAIKVNQAIIGKLPLKAFQKQFLNEFVGNADGMGMLERYYKGFVFDLYQKVDRQIQSEYSTSLGLNYAIYSGTLISTSRTFCAQRVNRLYTKNEIMSWKNLSFSGKPKVNYDPIRDAGGHQCRHIVSFISNELAEELIKTEGLNQYNTVAPRKKDTKKKKSIFS